MYIHLCYIVHSTLYIVHWLCYVIATSALFAYYVWTEIGAFVTSL